MPRPLRVEFPGAIYHVMSRGVAGMRTFQDNSDYREFLRLLGLLVDAGVLIVHAYCLMINHIHLLLETPLACLGRWMQHLLGDYAQGYNRRHRRQGHLWQARYKAILVEDGEYLLECSRYIHLNPNRKKLTRPAELWPWSSYRNYVGGPAMTDWVCTVRVLGHFAGRNDYQGYVESGRDETPISPFERARAGDRRQLHLPFDDNYTYRILRLLNHRVMVSKVERSWGFREQDFVSGNRKVHHLKTHVSTPSWPLVALDRSPFPPEAG